MTSDSPNMRQCTACRASFPATAEFFSRDRRDASGFYARCRSCRKAARRIPAVRQGAGDGLHGGVRETERQVSAAFQRRDPNCSEINELMRRLNFIVKRFGRMDPRGKAHGMAWFVREFFGGAA